MDQTNPSDRPTRRPRNGIYNLFVVALTVFSLAMGAAYYLLPLTEPTKDALLWIDLPISLIFLADAIGCLRPTSARRATSFGGPSSPWPRWNMVTAILWPCRVGSRPWH